MNSGLASAAVGANRSLQAKLSPRVQCSGQPQLLSAQRTSISATGALGSRDRPPLGLHVPAYVRRVVDRGRVQLFYLSRIMGTSVAMISTLAYGHLVPDS